MFTKLKWRQRPQLCTITNEGGWFGGVGSALLLRTHFWGFLKLFTREAPGHPRSRLPSSHGTERQAEGPREANLRKTGEWNSMEWILRPSTNGETEIRGGVWKPFEDGELGICHSNFVSSSSLSRGCEAVFTLQFLQYYFTCIGGTFKWWNLEVFVGFLMTK